MAPEGVGVLLGVEGGFERGARRQLAQGVGDVILGGSLNMADDAHGVAQRGVGHHHVHPITLGQVGLSSKGGDGEGPRVPDGGARTGDGLRSDEVEVGVGSPGPDDEVPGGPLDDAHSAGEASIRDGDVEKVEEVGKFRKDEDVEGQHSVGVREVAECRGEADGAVHELGQGLGEDIHGGDLGAEEDAQVPVDLGQLDRGPGAAWEALDKVSAGARREDDGLTLIDSKAGGEAKAVDEIHHLPQAGEVLGGDG